LRSSLCKILVLDILLVTGINFNLFSQYYWQGTEPASTRWKQIRTDRFRVVFPAEAHRLARRYADVLWIADSVVSKSLQAPRKPFDVVLHNKSIMSNGFVTWAPKRMEIVTHAPAGSYAQPWLTQLALHETRHVKQMYKLDGSTINYFYYIFGEQIVGASAAYVPRWFFEGDAVATETAMSNSGRGRKAPFYQYYRAHYLSNPRPFKYDKWLLGSYRDPIPDHYSLGYQLVSYSRLRYGGGIWGSTLDYVSKYPFPFAPFYFGLRRQTGLSRRQLFEQTFHYLDSTWRHSLQGVHFSQCEGIVTPTEGYTSYQCPYNQSDTTIVAYKKSLANTPCFVAVDPRTGRERILKRTGYMVGQPSYLGHWIVWSEYKPHMRWEYKDYGVVKLFNTARGTTTILPFRGRCFSPVINPVDRRIYALLGMDNGGYALIRFRTTSSAPDTVLFFPEGMEPFELTIDAQSGTLYFGITTPEGKQIASLTGDGLLKRVYGPTYLDINSVGVHGDSILFAATLQCKEDIFLFNLRSKNTFRVINAKYGSSNPRMMGGNTLLFAEYTPNGYRISKLQLDSLPEPLELPLAIDDPFTLNLKRQEKFNIDSVPIPSRQYEVTDYRGLKTLFRFHSWMPFYVDPYGIMDYESPVKYGVSAYSQNLTGTSVLVLCYGYDERSLVHANYRYYGFYPVFSVTYDLEKQLARYYNGSSDSLAQTQRMTFSTSVHIPFRLSQGVFSTYTYPFFRVSHSNDYVLPVHGSTYRVGLQTAGGGFAFSSLRRLAHRDIRPRVGFTLYVESEFKPFNSKLFGSLHFVKSNLYLPGVINNHSFMVSASVQQLQFKRYFLPNKAMLPRGYEGDFVSRSYQFVSASYLFPLAYPDVAVGSLVYVKRISANLFWDYARNRYPVSDSPVDREAVYQSKGFEVIFDVNFVRFWYPFRVKWQQGWRGKSDTPFSRVTLTLDLYNGVEKEPIK